MQRELLEMQVENLEKYLLKSKDTLKEFMNKNPDSEILDVPDVGWLEYAIADDVFWIHTAYSKVSHKFNKIIWKKVQKLAKKYGCDRIRFSTQRNPKTFQRLYGFNPIMTIMEYKLDKGD